MLSVRGRYTGFGSKSTSYGESIAVRLETWSCKVNLIVRALGMMPWLLHMHAIHRSDPTMQDAVQDAVRNIQSLRDVNG